MGFYEDERIRNKNRNIPERSYSKSVITNDISMSDLAEVLSKYFNVTVVDETIILNKKRSDDK